MPFYKVIEQMNRDMVSKFNPEDPNGACKPINVHVGRKRSHAYQWTIRDDHHDRSIHTIPIKLY